MAVRRGKFRAFLKPAPHSVQYDQEHSVTNSLDDEISVEISVGPRGEISSPDVEIAGGIDEPHFPGNPGLYIGWVKPGSDADRLLSPGRQLTKIDNTDVRNASRHEAENMLRFADNFALIHVISRGSTLDELSSQSSSKMVSWGTVSFDDDNSDSGRGTEVSEKEIKPIIDEGEKVNVKVSVGLRGQLLPLDFEIYGGQDEKSIDGNTGIFIKKIEEGSSLQRRVKIGDHILKVNGSDVSNVPQYIFFNMLRAADRVAKIQIRKIPLPKDDTEVRVFEDEETEENEKIVEISTGPKGRLGKLGLKINGGRDRPCVPGDPGIFITAVRRGSVLHKVIGPGDKILKIDGANVSNVPLRFAFDLIKAADRRVRFHIKTVDHSENDSSERMRKRSAWKAMRSFSAEHLEEYKVAFSVYDRTGKGKISLKQMMELCRQLGHNLTSIDKDVIATEFRLGGESKISFMDFIQILTKIKSSHQDDSDLLEAFEVFDREKKGFFRLHELEDTLTKFVGSDLTEFELAEILQLADSDGDGRVKFEEFKDLILPLFHQY